MISDLYRNDKEIWHMALWFLLALELASEVIELHVKSFCGPQFCLRLTECRTHAVIQLLLEQKVGS